MSMILSIRWFFYSVFYLLKIKQITYRKSWILSRTACLVNDTYPLLKLNNSDVYNVQKGRVDLLNSYFTNSYERPRLGLIKYINRPDIKKLFIQQKYFFLPRKNKPSLFILDSFSELVDKRFVGRSPVEGAFNAYFSDVDSRISKKMVCMDLLAEDKLFDSYLTFFNAFRSYSDCPILFVLFPDKLEKRQSYLTRSRAIKESIERIKIQIPNFHVFEIPDNLVNHAKNDSNPYHFGKEVYDSLANQIIMSNLLPVKN